MSNVTIEFPESILVGSHRTREEFVREAKLLLMARLFELGRISGGKAAQMCDMNRVDFLFACGRMGIPVVQMDEDEMRREFGTA